MSITIVIPARWGSTRFPGKPLAQLAGHSMLSRVVHLARRAIADVVNGDVLVATDDDRIIRHCDELNCRAVLTPSTVTTGSGRVLAALRANGSRPDYIINLQGDAPFIPEHILREMMRRLADQGTACVTPAVALTWQELDELRQHKVTSPSSGTTCITASDGRALWFSKQIIPQLRQEASLRSASQMSPVLRHLGVYGYALQALEIFEATSPTPMEEYEGLEQLRLLDIGLRIDVVITDAQQRLMSGIDTPEDLRAAERLIAEIGDPLDR